MALKCNPERRNDIPKPLLLQWYGLCVQQTALFNKNWSAACTLASLLGDIGIEVWFTLLPNPLVWLGIIVLQPINKMFATYYYDPEMSKTDFDYQLVSFEESLKRVAESLKK